MLDIDTEYIFDENGNAIAVQIPLNQFEQIQSLLKNIAQVPSQEASQDSTEEAELEYVDGILVVKSQGVKISADIVDQMREERIQEMGGW